MTRGVKLSTVSGHETGQCAHLPGLISCGSLSSSEIMPRVQSPEHAPSWVLRSGAVDSLWPLERYHSPIILFAGVAPVNVSCTCLALSWNISGNGRLVNAPEIFGHGVGNCWQSAIVPVYSGWTHVPTNAMPTLSVWIRGTGFRAQVLPFGTTGHTESSTYFAAPGIGYKVPLFHYHITSQPHAVPSARTDACAQAEAQNEGATCHDRLRAADKVQRHLLEVLLGARHLVCRAESVLICTHHQPTAANNGSAKHRSGEGEKAAATTGRGPHSLPHYHHYHQSHATCRQLVQMCVGS